MTPPDAAELAACDKMCGARRGFGPDREKELRA